MSINPNNFEQHKTLYFVLTILLSTLFSLLIILYALMSPLPKENNQRFIKKPANKLEAISQELKKKY